VLGSVLTRTRNLVRNYRYRWLDPAHNTEDIPIPPLVGPLRYDAYALLDLLRFYRANKSLARDDFAQFMETVRRLPFYHWKFVSHAIREPHTTRDATTFAPVYEEEVRQALDVWESVEQRGFDRKFPIEVRVTDRLQPASSGKHVAARYVLGDGSHRIACLILLGYTTLPKDHYRIRWYRRLRPNDATWLLTRKQLIPTENYFAFLSAVYGSPQVWRDRDTFLRDVQDRIPERLDEVRTILDVDGFGTR
jgi:hypothetical protein